MYTRKGQDQVAAKNIELRRVPSDDNEADVGTKYLERDRIKKCVTKMVMLFAGALAGEQLLVSWTLGVVLLITVGVVLLCCVFAVIVSHLPTVYVHVTREPAIEWCTSSRTMQDDDLDHLNVTENTWILSWRSAEAADGVEHEEFVREAGTVLAVHCHHE